MRKKGLLFLSLFLIATTLLGPACSRKTGCPAYESVHSRAGKKGELSTKGGKSELFPKHMRKKMGR